MWNLFSNHPKVWVFSLQFPWSRNENRSWQQAVSTLREGQGLPAISEGQVCFVCVSLVALQCSQLHQCLHMATGSLSPAPSFCHPCHDTTTTEKWCSAQLRFTKSSASRKISGRGCFKADAKMS